ncbi:MurR/RpiR family transcriptional regulator [Microlunatus soli]|uniref:DNA-binding transcriptional regulator, MurR/RpiR family, contains HTH and SIS domains n=1 Tax=Microlunatus soli TaxID=630515 RepID=A0A1H1YDL8_9ACTN|nr:MurR/RpiR family transcriptional regulator [Microlunatus soli]SDT19481.1 DNA-binding transcriptional regulator, MurR/RpiR family, contains HTH and SIS domains [Microlunatus soli]
MAKHTPGSETRAQPANPLQLITDALPRLRGGTARVARTILTSPDEIAAGSITRLAAAADTAPATVTRLATHLGFDGYPALRAAIARESGRAAQSAWESDIGSAIAPGDPADKVLNVLASTEVNALRNALASIDLAAVERAADAIAAAERVHVYGEWGDAIPAQELSIRLLRIGVPVWFHDGNQSSRIGAGLLSTGDVGIVVARSGNDPIAEEFVRLASAQGATTVVITGEVDSAVAGAGDIVLFTGTRNGRIWTEFFAGRASDVLTAGLLFVLVAQRVPDRVAAHNPYGPEHPFAGPAAGQTGIDDLPTTLPQTLRVEIDEPLPTDRR